ncbi:Transcriptional regulator LytR [Corynebacterium occultum]|uniref:Transcriptional regulator LytR n=1 Tax=Corynebacterium occultum TaxID=2675219 RepID=A0A6B8W5M1_9CORY|nr:LCP family protein [Corynebacterium occultum]QGU06615.1 Transcriptional regulator LytR [Corynebacterium occultum]
MNEKYRPVRDIQPSPEWGTKVRQAGPAALRGTIAFLSVLVLMVSAIGYFTVGRLGSEISSAGNLSLGGGAGDAPDGAVDILLVGSDSRTDAQGNPLSEEESAMLYAGDEEEAENTDTLMLIRVPNDGSSATAVSIPRDTYISTPEQGNLKINGVYGVHKFAAKQEMIAEAEAAGDTVDEKKFDEKAKDVGRSALISAVATLTGIEVDHYAEVGLLGFVLLTDAVGGVDVCLNEATQDIYSGADFPAGVQTLEGAQALSFVRQRHGLPRGDLDRIVRQQAYMASLVNNVLNAGTLTNPAKLASMGAAVERSVVLDEGWDVLSFATQLSNLAGGNVTFTTIPVTSIDGIGDYGESVVTVDQNQVHDFIDELLVPPAPAEEKEAPAEEEESVPDVAILVLNAGSTSGLAGGVGSHLKQNGWNVTEVSNAQPGIYWESQVVTADPTDPAAIELAEALGGLPITINEGLEPGTVVVVTHDEYAGPMDQEAVQEETPTTVGQPGADFGEDTEVAPEIDAGGSGPRCVN